MDSVAFHETNNLREIRDGFSVAASIEECEATLVVDLRRLGFETDRLCQIHDGSLVALHLNEDEAASRQSVSELRPKANSQVEIGKSLRSPSQFCIGDPPLES